MQAQNTFTSDAAELTASQHADPRRDGTRGNSDMVSIEFLSNLAHQLRSPLSSLRVWVDLLSDPVAMRTLDDTRRLSEGIERATSRLERQIQDVLEAGHLSAGTLKIDTVPVDATAQIVEAVTEAEHAARSRRISVDLNFNSESDIVIAEPKRVKQIVGYLFSNAIRFSPVDGSIILKTGSAPKIAQAPSTTAILEPQFTGRALYICVSDYGPGIGSEMHHEIFQPFFRATRKDVHGGGGSGLGLAIARGLIELHGGGLWLRSETGNGSDFEFSLPQALSPVELN